MTSIGTDRELLAVLVALEPLDERKWDYLNLTKRSFDADRMLEDPWSSGERALIEVAASLWNSGTVDLGYIASALGGRHLQAVIDATAIRAGQNLVSHVDRAIARLGTTSRESPGAGRGRRNLGIEQDLSPARDPRADGLGR